MSIVVKASAGKRAFEKGNTAKLQNTIVKKKCKFLAVTITSRKTHKDNKEKNERRRKKVEGLSNFLQMNLTYIQKIMVPARPPRPPFLI